MTWITIQLIALVLGATAVRWTANTPAFEGVDSLRVMLVTQVVLGTLLAPVICRSPASTIATAVALWPFIFSAGFLSAVEIHANALAGMYVMTWLLVLGMGLSTKIQPLLTTQTALVNLWVLIEPTITYLRPEFIDQKSLVFGPILSVFLIIDSAAKWQIIFVPLVLLAIVTTFRLLRRTP